MRLGLGAGTGKVRGVPATLPETISGLVDWLRAGEGLTLGAGGTKVESWQGIRGSVAAKVADASRPNVATEGGLSVPDFVFANASELLMPIALGKVFTIAMVLRTGVRTQQGQVAAESAGAVKQCQAFADAPGTTMYWQALTGTARTTTALFVQAQLESWTFVVSASRCDLFRNGVKTAGAGGSTLAADVAQLRLGSIAVGAYFNEGNILDVLAYNVDIGDTDIGRLDTYLRGLRSVP